MSVNPQLQAHIDSQLLQMVNMSGGLNPFLDSVFSFLQRRTDFYYEAEPGDKMGFPPQYSEQLVSRILSITALFHAHGESFLKHVF